MSGELDEEAAYQRMLVHLYALRTRGVRFDLEALGEVAERLGRPERRYEVIHIGGTNGKGSTAAFIESILRADGWRTGLYTSPHLSRYTERIRVCGQEIPRREVVRLVAAVERAAAPRALTFFELGTLAAFAWFAEQKVEIAVVEVGLGGRLDATNLVPRPLASVITRIALDHQAMLGGTLGEIAREKAGIVKPGCDVVASLPGPSEDPRGEVARVLEEASQRAGASLFVLGRDFDCRRSQTGYGYEGPGGALDVPVLGLAGAHQVGNAALALCAVSALERRGLRAPSVEARRTGLAHLTWPARMEMLLARSSGGKTVPFLLDGAHNPDAARALAAALGSTGPRFLVFGALSDKDAAGMLSVLAPLMQKVWLTAPASDRATDPRQLQALVPGALVVPSLEQALAEAQAAAAEAGPDASVVVTGSIYLCGEVRRRLLGESADPVAVADSVTPAAR